LFGEFQAAEQAIVTDHDGKELSRTVLFDDTSVPQPPEGGKVKIVPVSKIFASKEFGYRTVTIERPLKDENGNMVIATKGKAKGKPQPDSSLRDTENVPLSEDVEDYFKREVLPHVPDAWIDQDKRDKSDGEVGVVGYEIPFNRHFYVFEPPRELAEIDADLKAVMSDIQRMIGEMSA
jgi:type I restriction enzyme M protein